MALTSLSSCSNVTYLVQPRTRMRGGDENNNFVISNNTKRALFGSGSSNIVDIEMLLEEQQRIDRERFLNMFGINIDDLEDLDCEESWNTSGYKRVLCRLELIESSVSSSQRSPIISSCKRTAEVIDCCLPKKDSSK
ncbi:hypothetical protein ILUMI_23823 [Ignelater luminosus]|uniref:Uncharacterized protein n=1 Tax=Ignelater luminosus TaxID=2038154 RepID=A0A8K0C848_IGNLU|nr:hypothetical protein ILUMI_23823 [Ignelater luminosus]